MPSQGSVPNQIFVNVLGSDRHGQVRCQPPKAIVSHYYDNSVWVTWDREWDDRGGCSYHRAAVIGRSGPALETGREVENFTGGRESVHQLVSTCWEVLLPMIHDVLLKVPLAWYFVTYILLMKVIYIIWYLLLVLYIIN